MANFLTVRKYAEVAPSIWNLNDAYYYNQRKYAGIAPSIWNLNDAYYYNQRKYAGIAPSIWNLNDAYYYNIRKYAAFPQGEDFIINNGPVVDNPIPDQEVIEGNEFDFDVPADTFSDPDLDVLVLSATLDDDSPLPDWLTFNPITENFSGTPNHSDIDVLNIKVTATDPFALSVSDIFVLEVLEDLTIKTRDFLKSFRALLPKGRAWNIDLSVQFKQVIDAIMDSSADVKQSFLDIGNDVFPDDTRSLELWEEQFLLDPTGLTEAERRSNLEARWSAQGGQSPSYIESVLLKLGITATVYENFDRLDPVTFLVGGDSEILTNGKIVSEQKGFINTCGDPSATCGSGATAGEFDGFITTLKEYIVSVDTAKWIHYFIVADPASVATPLNIPASLEKAFKTAILTVKPVQTRAILNVNYI